MESDPQVHTGTLRTVVVITLVYWPTAPSQHVWDGRVSKNALSPLWKAKGVKGSLWSTGTLQMWLMMVTRLLLYFWDKTPPPQRPIKVVFNWALGSRGFWFVMADGGMVTEAAESSHLELPAEGTGHTVKGMGSCETSKPVPSIIGPLARPHLLILPKQPPMGAQVFKCPAVMQDPLFKPPRLTRTE